MHSGWPMWEYLSYIANAKLFIYAKCECQANPYTGKSVWLVQKCTQVYSQEHWWQISILSENKQYVSRSHAFKEVNRSKMSITHTAV